jgi:glycosyltransferase involved in cell wall biosynthesis
VSLQTHPESDFLPYEDLGTGQTRLTKSPESMKVALVYDRINKFGGAERLLSSLKNIYPKAPIFTLVHNPKTAKWASKFKIIASPINSVSFLRTRHQWLSPVSAMMFETFNFDNFDLVISLTSESAKAVITKPNTLHICYCLTPTRYLWGSVTEYSQDIKMKILPSFAKKYFKAVDLLISRRPDQYIAISKEVKSRLSKYYQQESSIIYPSIEDKFYSKKTPSPLKDRDYYLVAGRLEPYKRTDLVINTFNHLQGASLKVVGTGKELKRLKGLGHKNIEFLGQVSDNQLKALYQNARAVIYPQIEDFGLIPVEAQASGTPVIAFAKGGAKETVIHNHTGLLFNHQTIQSLTKAITKFESGKHLITPQKCLNNAKEYSKDRFIISFHDKVTILWQKHQQNLSI